MDIKEAVRPPSLDWEVICRDPRYKWACVDCQALLILGGRHPFSYNCFQSALVDQTDPQLLSKSAVANSIPIENIWAL